MEQPPRPHDEAARLAALAEYRVLDTPPEQAYDDITKIAAQICGVPIALVSLIDTDRQWFKSRVGLDAAQTPRDVAFCAHAILGNELFVVPDAHRDERFRDNPLVTGDPRVRFYAGAPLRSPGGQALGTLCVIDRAPRRLEPRQAEALEALGRQVVAQLELRRRNRRMQQDLEAAAAVQRALLPGDGLAEARAAFAWSYRPCDELGGDLLGVFRLDEDRLGCYMLDVSGHGVAAALLSVAASRLLAPVPDESSLVRRRVGPGKWRVTEPAEVAGLLNRRFDFERTRQYFTLLYGVMDLAAREFRFVGAGHPGPVQAPRGGAPRVLHAPGHPIGLVDEPEFEERTVPLGAGDRLWLYSDGVTEAKGPGGELFGEDRLLAEGEARRGLPLREAVDTLTGTVEAWSGGRPEDDVSVLVAEIP